MYFYIKSNNYSEVKLLTFKRFNIHPEGMIFVKVSMTVTFPSKCLVLGMPLINRRENSTISKNTPYSAFGDNMCYQSLVNACILFSTAK